jgi:hypothetical protein
MARVVILLPGQDAPKATMVPLARRLEKEGMKNIIICAYQITEKDPLPIKELDELIKRIRDISSHKIVDIVLIGHSLGAIIGLKYTYSGRIPKGVRISKIISLAGRLRYIRNLFWWCCDTIKKEIKKTYDLFEKDPNRVSLFTIAGGNDGLVPLASVHIATNPYNPEQNKGITVEGCGHLGIVFSQKAHEKISSKLQA